jgi:hypothetical protein
MFGRYSDFQKELEDVVTKGLHLDLKKLTVPDLGSFVIETVVSEINKIKYEEKERVARETEKRIRELLGANKNNMTLKELEDLFAISMWDNYLKSHFEDDCYCGDRDEPQDLADVIELIDGEDYFEFELNEKEWGTYGRYCMTHLYLKFNYKKYDEYIEVHVSRKPQQKEEDSEFYKEGKDNIYSILSMSINGKSIENEGFITLYNVTEKTAQGLLSRLINGGSIDCTELSNFELVSE